MQLYCIELDVHSMIPEHNSNFEAHLHSSCENERRTSEKFINVLTKEGPPRAGAPSSSVGSGRLKHASQAVLRKRTSQRAFLFLLSPLLSMLKVRWLVVKMLVSVKECYPADMFLPYEQINSKNVFFNTFFGATCFDDFIIG